MRVVAKACIACLGAAWKTLGNIVTLHFTCVGGCVCGCYEGVYECFRYMSVFF